MISLLISITASFVFLCSASLFPFFLLRGTLQSRSFSTSLSIANCFASGVFLATCFLGLLPHAKMSEKVALEKLFSDNTSKTGTFVNTNFIVLVGFATVLLVEQILLMLTARDSSSGKHVALPQRISSHCCGRGEFAMTSMNPDPTLLNKTTQKHVNDVSGSKQLEERRRVEQQKDGGSDSEPLVRLDENSGDDLPGTSDNIDDETEDFESIQFRYYDDSRRNSGEEYAEKFNHSSHIFLLVAMMTHSVFEGVALGAQINSPRFIKTLVAFMVHEILCSFSYGISLASQNVSIRRSIFFTCLLSSSIPIGMFVMLLMDTLGETQASVLKFVLESASAGIFIYVACLKMLAGEFLNLYSKPTDFDYLSMSNGGGRIRRWIGVLKSAAVFTGIFVAFMANNSARLI